MGRELKDMLVAIRRVLSRSCLRMVIRTTWCYLVVRRYSFKLFKSSWKYILNLKDNIFG
jgi:hypothetical protein